MTGIGRTFSVLAASLLAVLFSASANAQATRTWVSAIGDDLNNCSRTTPCKTFAGTITKTAPGGEIDVLDPGDFRSVTITKSISIIDDNVGEAGVFGNGFNGFIIQAGPSDVVTLRGLFFNGLGTSLSGILFISGGTLNVEKCRIFGFAGLGINFQPTGASQLNVIDTEVFQNGTGTGFGGILIQPQSGGNATGVIDRVRVLNNLNTGIWFDGTVAGAGPVAFTVKNSVSSGNAGHGIHAISKGSVTVVVDTDLVANNTGDGVRAQGVGATITLTNSTVTGHLSGTGINRVGGGILASYLNNNVSGNWTDGNSTATITQK